MASFRPDQVQKNGGGKKEGHLISLYNIFIIYQSIAIIHLLVSRAIIEHKLLN